MNSHINGDAEHVAVLAAISNNIDKLHDVTGEGKRDRLSVN
jgi:hypothetical protein